MKYIILFFMCLNVAQAKEPEPKFYKTQNVTYKVGFFLSKVCSGKGTVSNVESSDGLGSYTYTIQVPQNEINCPRIERKEFELKAAE